MRSVSFPLFCGQRKWGSEWVNNLLRVKEQGSRGFDFNLHASHFHLYAFTNCQQSFGNEKNSSSKEGRDSATAGLDLGSLNAILISHVFYHQLDPRSLADGRVARHTGSLWKVINLMSVWPPTQTVAHWLRSRSLSQQLIVMAEVQFNCSQIPIHH